MILALRHHRHVGAAQSGVMPMPTMPSGRATSLTCARCATAGRGLVHYLDWRADSSNCPPGSSEMAPPPVASNRPAMLPLR
jgi:hypothetical protein